MEMGNVGVDFTLLSSEEKSPLGWNKASIHLLFDVKMDFTCNSSWVKDGHRNPDYTMPSYANVVSCDSIIIAMTYTALM